MTRWGGIVSKLLSKVVQGCWNIGFITNTLESVLNGEDVKFQWMKHNCCGSWFADPFILAVTDTEIVVLVEEYVIKEKKGRISKLTIDRQSCRLRHIEPVLSLSHHLSFPIIRRSESGDIFLYPEASESRMLTEYRLMPGGVLDQNYSRIVCYDTIVDPILFNKSGHDYMLATSMPLFSGNTLDVYQKRNNSLFEKKYSLVFDENVARNAGDLFMLGGKTYRPAQECNHSYGHAIVIQEMQFEHESFLFKEIRRIYCASPNNQSIGLHTFNVFKDIIVVDKRWSRMQWIVNTIDYLVKTKHKVFNN